MSVFLDDFPLSVIQFTATVAEVLEPVSYDTGVKREIRVHADSEVGDGRKQTIPVELRGKFVDLKIGEGMRVFLTCYLSGREYIGRRGGRRHCHLSLRVLDIKTNDLRDPVTLPDLPVFSRPDVTYSEEQE